MSNQTLAVLFGASTYRRAPRLAQGRAFYNSAEDFRLYLVERLALPRENVLSLFDDSRSPGDQLQEIRSFLDDRSRRLNAEGTAPEDLVVYYVGHGLFWGPDHTYSFAIRATDEESEGLTSIRASDLAFAIKSHARFLRKLLILDCCFSAAAHREFQAGPSTVASERLLQELPQIGTTLLCSASAHDPSLAPAALNHTMFSNGLLKVLREGHASLGPYLSLCEVGDLIKAKIREEFPDTGVRPEIHSPDQREGEVGWVPIFPNPAYLKKPPTPDVVPKKENDVKPPTSEVVPKKEKDVKPPTPDPVPKKDKDVKPPTDPARRRRVRIWVAASIAIITVSCYLISRPSPDPTPTDNPSETKPSNEFLTLSGHSGSVQSVAWSPNGKRLATGSQDKTAKIWDAATGTTLLTLRGHRDHVRTVAWSPDGKRLATASWDNTAKIWDAETGICLLTFSGQSDHLTSVAWSPNGKQLATASWDNTAKIWDPETGNDLLTLNGHGDHVTSVAWKPDGTQLATGSDDKTAKIWDAGTGKDLLTLSGHGKHVTSVAWSPDGTQLVTGSEDRTAKTWNARTGTELLTLRGHTDHVRSVAWSPDGTQLATASNDNTAEIWDAKTGRGLLNLSAHSHHVTSVAWRPDGMQLATGSDDKTAKTWVNIKPKDRRNAP
jgi:WD40 repeat protein